MAQVRRGDAAPVKRFNGERLYCDVRVIAVELAVESLVESAVESAREASIISLKLRGIFRDVARQLVSLLVDIVFQFLCHSQIPSLLIFYNHT